MNESINQQSSMMKKTRGKKGIGRNSNSDEYRRRVTVAL